VGYEARAEAMNDYVAERAREMMPAEDEYTMDEDIPEVIKDGSYDVAVLLRAAAIFDERGFAFYPGVLRAMAEALKAK